jgi:hypothetical protein
MERIARPVRIEPAFADRERVRSLFYDCAPYPVLGVYVPDGADDTASGQATSGAVMPWFRGNWAVGGEALVDGADSILNNPRFHEAAKAAFGTRIVRPRTIAVNLTTPMAAGSPHVDIPSFRGATREHYPLRFLAAMGESRLFERWRVVEAGAIAWFYDGPGGNFDYWPDGLDGAMCTETAPFGNVAIIADNDRMFHRIGAVGSRSSTRPHIGPGAQIQALGSGDWAIVEKGHSVATYPAGQVRLSVLWKAEVFADDAAERDANADRLSLDRVMEILRADLRRRGIEFVEPGDPLNSEAWITTLREAYYTTPSGGRL